MAYSPGYKCIWAKTLERDPRILLVHSRNGGLYKVDLATGETLATLKDVPDALWSTIVLPGGDLLAAGEGDHLLHYRLASVDRDSRAQRFETAIVTLPMAPDSYTKRIIQDPATGMIAFGRTDGDLWAGIPGNFRRIANLGSAIRDIAFDTRRQRLLAATEDGRIVAIDPVTGAAATLYQDDALPFARAIWALAYNPARDLLAFAAFGTTFYVVSLDDFAIVATTGCARVKRIRWSGPANLLFGSSDEIERLDIETGEATVIVRQMQNTIEDFIWDRGRRYLVAICYQCTIGLFDFETGARLDHVRDQIDYSKGLAWLDPAGTEAYPMDFVTWGRSGDCHHYRIHNERIVALGPVAAPNVAAERRRDAPVRSHARVKATADA